MVCVFLVRETVRQSDSLAQASQARLGESCRVRNCVSARATRSSGMPEFWATCCFAQARLSRLSENTWM